MAEGPIGQCWSGILLLFPLLYSSFSYFCACHIYWWVCGVKKRKGHVSFCYLFGCASGSYWIKWGRLFCGLYLSLMSWVLIWFRALGGRNNYSYFFFWVFTVSLFLKLLSHWSLKTWLNTDVKKRKTEFKMIHCPASGSIAGDYDMSKAVWL